jgi:hypothetical protein
MHHRWPGGRLLAAAAALLGAAATLQASDPAFLTPSSGESLAPGSVIQVAWRSACESDLPPAFDEAELVLSLDGGLTYPIRVSRELDPCESTISWRVPALAAGSARLALRLGEESEWESEEIVAVSDTFQILPDADGRVEQLVARSGEWGVEPGTEVLEARDLLSRSMRPAAERLTVPAELVAFSLPAPAAALHPERRASGLVTERVSGRRRPSLVPPAPHGAPTPLRL